MVRSSARLLADAVQSYTFISTLSVYPDDAPAGCDEGTPTHQPPFPDTEEITDESYGPLKLYIDDEVVAEQEIKTMTGHFSLCGEGLCIGYDGGDAVSAEYAGSRFEFTGGTIAKVVFDVADDAYVDVERHLAAAMMRD